MDSGYRFKLLSALIISVLILSLVAPTVVFANEPTPETPTEETAPEATAEEAADVAVEETDIPETENTETAPETETEEATAVAVEETGTPETENTETAPEEAAEVNVAEVVELIAETGTVLLDADGDAISLVSQEAVTALTAPDPIGCPPGVLPTTWGGTGTGCTISYSSIQSAINDAAVVAGWTIYIDPGTFYENVQVNKSVTLQGSGQGVTIVKPANNDANTCQGSCPNATNSVIWVLADGVSIFDLTVDGDNELLSGGQSVGGADINAHNGIITNSHTDLTVQNVTVQNVFARGIQVGSSGGNFNISNNTVDNVQGDSFSIGIFGYTSGGVIDGNQVSNVGDGIALNWSTGTQITNNTVTHASSGIHTDNTNGADVISNNTISNGKSNSYGIFVFAPYEQVTVNSNTITGVDIGLTVAGNGFNDALNEIIFDGNKVTANIAGGLVTSDVWWYFKSNAKATFSNNTISGGQYGLLLESQAAADYVNPYYGASGCTGDCVVEVTLICNTINGQIFQATGMTFWDGDTTPNYNGTYLVDDSGNVCTVTPGPSQPKQDNRDDRIVPPSITTLGALGFFIPVTGDNIFWDLNGVLMAHDGTVSSEDILVTELLFSEYTEIYEVPFENAIGLHAVQVNLPSVGQPEITVIFTSEQPHILAYILPDGRHELMETECTLNLDGLYDCVAVYIPNGSEAGYQPVFYLRDE